MSFKSWGNITFVHIKLWTVLRSITKENGKEECTWKSVLPHPRINTASPVNAILGWGWSGASPVT